ncbi:Uncharacterized protein C3H8.04 [Tolypocladium ophioglossoides CBS 100239]|uniref:Uncharacterized protein C3H8.04 n=1 Tax=Tolypocladium ophioglossoides (strain CBS 100239) TaxID=1163406 RepID=A0A0L0N4K1_TOLOC|nr:Uncharacterized protein C3H8.04 [Tolypocladium ophioglossoides CBS 100239]
MPIFQADLDHDHDHDHGSPCLDPEPTPRLRRLSEESLRTELCEGPIPDSPTHPSTPRSEDDGATSNRTELIERLKRGESPTWIPNRHLESILQHGNTVHVDRTSRPSSQSSGLLPPAQITPEKNNTAQSHIDERLQDGLNIERPRSALHSGDFTNDERQEEEQQSSTRSSRQKVEDGLSAQSPWIATSPPRDYAPPPDSVRSFRPTASPLSSSLASSFAYQLPTSPLLQSESNDELDFSMPPGIIDLSAGRLSSRRHTLTSSNPSPFASPSSRPSMTAWTPLQRRDGSLPYQAHQPRRSLTSAPSFLQHGTSPQTPAMLRSRRPSLGSDLSPIQHASMVGSYEESILRGRMSTTPSKPFDFLAQIGVLGKGKCKSSLRCPAHVTLPFPAVYYNYSSTPHGRSRSDDGPSPYVGQVDLENGLSNLEEESRSKRKAQSRYSDRKPADGDLDMAGSDADLERRRQRPKRRSGSPKAPPGGSYRIPEKGQIQIIIKSQNKTAVKLFLVPYDLTGMEPGTKTFIRQRSYSAGSIIDHVPNPSETDSMSRPMLRYLVHLHICCPSRGRFYLYKSIRVVFANRVPDGKEKLRNETTWPEPRFSPYKPIRVMHPPTSSSGAMLAAEKAIRRRSLGVSVGGASIRAFDTADGLYSNGQGSKEQFSGAASGNTLPVDPIPFRLPPRDCGDTDDISDSTQTSLTAAGLRSTSSSSQASRPSTKDSAGLDPWGASQYEKLNKGDLGYGGNAFNSSLAGADVQGGGTEGLLSQRLRSLGVKPRSPGTQDD